MQVQALGQKTQEDPLTNNGNPVFLLRKSHGQEETGVWATVHKIAKSWTQLNN